jgi:hypothetical protein
VAPHILPAQTLDIPKELRVPEGQTLLLRLHGEGKQIYSCRNAADVYAWKLKGRGASLRGSDLGVNRWKPGDGEIGGQRRVFRCKLNPMAAVERRIA